jgi:DNA topoisomerase-3
MHCILAEKPSVARDLAAVLGTPEKHQGFLLIPPHWIVTWAYGHLVTLAAPDVYDPAWKDWRWNTLPMVPDPFQLVPIAESADQWAIVQGLFARPDVTDIVIATDADREGDGIAANIVRLSGVQKPLRRLWLSETTPTAIRAAMKAMRPWSPTASLALAATARAEADWLVGLNATRAFTLRHRSGKQVLSVGRVQTPTLRLVVDRDRAIDAFTPVPYWIVDVPFDAPPGTYVGRWIGTAAEHPERFATQAAAQALAATIPAGTPGVLTQVDRKRVTVQPPRLFSLNDLQKEAYRRLHLTAQQTLDAAQRLYEGHWTSYPRTDTQALTAAVAATLPQRIQGLGSTYAPLIKALPHPLPSARLIDEKAVAAAGHHAIIPTGTTGTAMRDPDAAVYDVIVRRFFAALLPAGTDERTTLWTEAAQARFRTQGTAIIDPGWRIALPPVADPDADADDTPPAIPPGLQSGMAVRAQTPQVLERTTKAPPRLNDASLLTLMEKHGLGTPATRAHILEILLTRHYVERKKRTLQSTAQGQGLLAVVPDAIQSPDLTGHWEQQLEAIAQSGGDPHAFLAAIRQYTQTLVDTARAQTAAPTAADPAQDFGSCPICHQGTITPTPKGWGCSRWRDGCRFTIWKTVAGKTLTPTQVKTLLSGKPTREIQGFRSKAGKSFAAQLQLVGDRVTFVFAAPSASDHPPQRAGRRRS